TDHRHQNGKLSDQVSTSTLHSKSGKPEILEQLDQYRKYAMDPKRNGEIVEAYKSACQIYVAIDEMRGDTPDELVSAVAGNEELIIDTEPRVIVYDYKEKQVARASSWMLRDEPLIRTRVKLLMEPNAKQIRL
ncbi:MAG: hypothetical protein P1V21_27695, partial [Rhizobiaceae bacterium]|nr:hypothetical protein [Rhizobiaceae bacterium]